MAESVMQILIEAIDNASKTIGSIAGALGKMQEQSSPIASLGRGMQDFGERAVNVGNQMSAMFTAPMVDAINTAGNFQAEMNGVRAISRATGDDFEALTELAKELGSTTQFSASEAAQAQQFLAAAGFETNEILASLPDTLNLAAAGSLDLASAADISSNILSGMSLSVDDLGHVNDVLATAAASSNTNIQQLGTAFEYVGPNAVSAGQDIHQMVAAVGILSDAGMQSEKAGTILRRGLIQMLAPTAAGEAALDRLGVSITEVGENGVESMRPFDEIIQSLSDSGADFKDINDIFGAVASGGIQTLMARSEDLSEFEDSLHNVEGAAQEMAEIRMEGFAGGMKALQSAAEGLMIAIGEAGILDIATSLVGAITGVVQAIANAPPPILNVITAIGGILAIAGPLLIVVGTLAGAIGAIVVAAGAISTAFAAGGIFAAGGALAGVGAAMAAITAGPVIAGVLAIAAAGVLIYKNWGKLSGFFSGFWEGLTSSMGPALQNLQVVGSTIMEALQPIISWLSQLLFGADSAAGSISNLGMAFGMMAGAVLAAVTGLPMNLGMMLQSIWAIISSFINQTIMRIRMINPQVMGALFQIIGTVTSTIMSLRGIVLQTIGGIALAIGGLILGIKTTIVTSITGAMTQFVAAIQNGQSLAVAAFQALGSAILGLITGIAGQMFEAGANIVGRLAEGIMSGVGRVTSAMSSVANAARSMLPMSPVPSGPLTVLNNARTNPGAKIVEMLGAGMRSAVGSGVLDNSLAMPTVPSANALMPSPSGGGAGGGSITLNYSPTINGGDRAGIEETLQLHIEELRDMLAQLQHEDSRVSYG